MWKTDDVYDVVLPIFIISKILGLAPFTLRRKKLKAHFFGPILLIRIILVIGGMCYVAFLLEALEYKTGIAELALKCELYLGTLVTFTVLTLAISNQKLLIRCIEKIASVDINMKNIKIEVNYKKAKKIVLVQVIVMTCVFLFKFGMQYFTNTIIMMFMYSAFNVFDYVNTIMLLQYVNILLLIRQRFLWLNRKLKQFSKLTCSSNDLNIAMSTRYRGQYYVEFDSAFVLTSIAKIYGRLCEISRLVNRVYGVQILATIGSRFIMITTQLIHTYNIIRNPAQGNNTKYVLPIIYLILHSLKIFMIASVSGNTAEKAKDTGIYLHNIWEVVPKLKDEIEYISLQILHENLKFTACGFFVLDYTLIYAIVGAITTYLIIVIQLEKAF